MLTNQKPKLFYVRLIARNFSIISDVCLGLEICIYWYIYILKGAMHRRRGGFSSTHDKC
jgi:hypothetical protein